MSTLSPALRLDRFQLAWIEALSDALNAPTDVTVAWAYGEAIWNDNIPTGKCVNLTILNGPSFHLRNKVNSGQTYYPPTLLTVTVDTVAAGVRFVVTINDYDYSYDALLGDTVDDVRDELVAAIVADSLSPYTAVATANPGEFTVTPTAVGDIWQFGVYPTNRFTVVPTLSVNAYIIIEGTRRFTVNVGCFSKARTPRAGAWYLASQIEAMTTSPYHVDIFTKYGVALWGKSPVLNLSAVDNGHWESRVSLDIDCAMRAVFTLPIDQIDTVNFVSLDLYSPDISQSFSVP